MNRVERITEILKRELAPEQLLVRDDSHKHAGHAGASPEGETHMHVLVVSRQLQGLSRVQKHRRIFELLKEETAGGLHALSLDVREA